MTQEDAVILILRDMIRGFIEQDDESRDWEEHVKDTVSERLSLYLAPRLKGLKT